MNKTRQATHRSTDWLMKQAFQPGRIRSIALTAALVGSFMVQAPTPAQAAAIWTHKASAQISHMANPTAQTGADPAYQPPAKQGANYAAPTTKAKQSGSNGSAGSEKLNLRTRNSRTFATGGHQLTTFVYADSV